MHSGPTYVTAFILLMVLACGCRGDDPPRTHAVTDDLGRTIEVSLPVARVATLAPSLTEMVFAVGGGDRLVGAGVPDDYPSGVDSLPRYSTYPVDFEALTALRPDLILATTQVNSPRTAETLAAVGIPTYFLSFSRLEDVFEAMETTGRLLGTFETARAAVDSLKRSVAELHRRTREVGHRPSVLVLIGPETLYSFGKPSYIHELVDLAGGRSITKEMESAAPVLSEEYVLTRAPDVIVGLWDDDVGPAILLDHHPAWDAVPALRAGRVYGVEADLVARPGPRLVEGAYELARRLHPDLFSTPHKPLD